VQCCTHPAFDYRPNIVVGPPPLAEAVGTVVTAAESARRPFADAAAPVAADGVGCTCSTCRQERPGEKISIS